MSQSLAIENAPFADRRRELVAHIEAANPSHNKAVDCVLLWGNFAIGSGLFKQESSFYYLTGVQEAGAAVLMDMQSQATLFVPRYAASRNSWYYGALSANEQNARALHFEQMSYLGAEVKGFTISPYFPKAECETIIARLKEVVANGGSIYTLRSEDSHAEIEQRIVINHVAAMIPGFAEHLVDICPQVYAMRRKKDPVEMGSIFQATEITMAGHEAAAQVIAAQATECEVCAAVEGVFISVGARPAFASIVASGSNATVLHYEPQSCNRVLEKNELVIVDVGAEWEHYCADVSRTYPVSGKFTDRQRELYTLVLETQRHVEFFAKPGYWLNNADMPEKSLTHIARKYLDEHGDYGKYMIHGIGHFVGLDVHDVTNGNNPLAEGDVITLEPGIYIPEESIGIRIEDNYWIGDHGVMCLTDELPKNPDDVEAFVQGTYEAPAGCEGECCGDCEHEA